MQVTSRFKLLLSALVAVGLAGCASNQAASIKGACDAFVAPSQPIKSADRYSQRWSDGQVEAGVSACGWPRPKA